MPVGNSRELSREEITAYHLAIDLDDYHEERFPRERQNGAARKRVEDCLGD